MAGWQSGHAADCKSVYLGSTPGPASIFLVNPQIIEIRCKQRIALILSSRLPWFDYSPHPCGPPAAQASLRLLIFVPTKLSGTRLHTSKLPECLELTPSLVVPEAIVNAKRCNMPAIVGKRLSKAHLFQVRVYLVSTIHHIPVVHLLRSLVIGQHQSWLLSFVVTVMVGTYFRVSLNTSEPVRNKLPPNTIKNIIRKGPMMAKSSALT